ncbi:hypothetical protein JCM17823_07170 [Halorubrum gandharaense]
MQAPNIPFHFTAGAVSALLFGGVAALMSVNLASVRGGDLASRYAGAQATLSVADSVVSLAASALFLGIGVGLVVGGLWAYHREVSSR